ncbi:hypothetical protein [Fontivita pretiosa]|uniref:hypothetical protein n=1 Tax=Fontivita pretiosa TaxID=2989684 RepID=UPI003D182838
MGASIELDKTITTNVESNLGKIVIRAVVLAKQKGTADDKAQEISADGEDDEAYPDLGKGPLDSYLEDPRAGRGYAVFIINGQRHHQWDNTFIVRDLGLKYLRNRTMIIVDLDTLSSEAIAEIIQGSRQGLYEGAVYHAIRDRVVATLKKDPDLDRLEDAAEQEISDLRTGDEAVKKTLNQLIEDHHAFASHVNEGAVQPGDSHSKMVEAWEKDRNQDVVVSGDKSVGDPATGPVLVLGTATASLRLQPGKLKAIRVTAEPVTAWKCLKGLHVDVPDAFEGLNWAIEKDAIGATIKLMYEEPSDFDKDEYPIEAGMRIIGRFDGYDESRLIERRVIASIPGPPPPPLPPQALVNPPTHIRVSSRQPVRLLVGGADTHVRLKWDGMDSLVLGTPPLWQFVGHCLTIPAYPAVAFSRPAGGRFEMLIPAPVGLPVGQKLVFEVKAVGPNSMALVATFDAEVAEAPEPRKIRAKAPDSTGQRRPPYEIKIIGQQEWDTGCWGDEAWTEADAACFKEPTPKNPLTLIINEDQSLWRAYRESMIRKKLVEATIKERTTRYISHLGFHLYQMYQRLRQVREHNKSGGNLEEPKDEAMREEINRVAATLIRLMEVSR